MYSFGVPALPNVNKVVRLDYQFRLVNGVPGLTRQFYRYGGTAPTAGNLNTFTAAAAASYGTNGVPEMVPGYRLIGIEATDLTTTSSAQFLQVLNAPGTRAGDFIPVNAAAVTAYHVNRRYRGGHPRGYWPFGVQADLDDEDNWSDDFVAEFEGAIGSLQADIEAGGWAGAGTIDQVNVSYYHGFTVVISPTTGRASNLPTPRSVPLVDVVTAIVGRARVGTQRRRLG